MFLTVLMYICLTIAAVAAIPKLKKTYRVFLILGVFLSILTAGLHDGLAGFFYEVGRAALFVLLIPLALSLAEHIYAAWIFRGMSIPCASQLKTLKGRSQAFYATFVKYLKKLWLAD